MTALENFDKYIGLQGILALLITGAYIYWISVGITIPTEINTLLGAVWGFYFAKNGSTIVSGIASRFQKG
jgi:hypothetical protein